MPKIVGPSFVDVGHRSGVEVVVVMVVFSVWWGGKRRGLRAHVLVLCCQRPPL